MNHTPQIKKAVQFAARKHHGQLRREAEPLPYITHLFSAALLVAEDGDDDEVVIAALLHDTIEDTDTTKEEIAREFGPRVASIVAEVTEPKLEGDRDVSWKERKKLYLAQIDLGSEDALLVAVADKIDNIESKLEALVKEGAQLFDRFHAKLDDYVWYHGAVLHMAQKRLPKHPLTKRLEEACAREEREFARHHTLARS